MSISREVLSYGPLAGTHLFCWLLECGASTKLTHWNRNRKKSFKYELVYACVLLKWNLPFSHPRSHLISQRGWRWHEDGKKHQCKRWQWLQSENKGCTNRNVLVWFNSVGVITANEIGYRTGYSISSIICLYITSSQSLVIDKSHENRL